MDLATIVLSLGMLGATVADVETTRYALTHGGRELNPIMQPFASSPAALYAVKGGVNLGVGILSHKLRRSSRKHERILGWALPVLSIAAQSAAAAHNSRR